MISKQEARKQGTKVKYSGVHRPELKAYSAKLTGKLNFAETSALVDFRDPVTEKLFTTTWVGLSALEIHGDEIADALKTLQDRMDELRKKRDDAFNEATKQINGLAKAIRTLSELS